MKSTLLVLLLASPILAAERDAPIPPPAEIFSTKPDIEYTIKEIHPAEYVSRTRSIVVKEASSAVETIPPIFETRTRKVGTPPVQKDEAYLVMVRPEQRISHPIPAVLQDQNYQECISPENFGRELKYRIWKRKGITTYAICENDVPLKHLVLQDCPPPPKIEYETILIKPAEMGINGKVNPSVRETRPSPLPVEAASPSRVKILGDTLLFEGEQYRVIPPTIETKVVLIGVTQSNHDDMRSLESKIKDAFAKLNERLVQGEEHFKPSISFGNAFEVARWFSTGQVNAAFIDAGGLLQVKRDLAKRRYGEEADFLLCGVSERKDVSAAACYSNDDSITDLAALKAKHDLKKLKFLFVDPTSIQNTIAPIRYLADNQIVLGRADCEFTDSLSRMVERLKAKKDGTSDQSLVCFIDRPPLDELTEHIPVRLIAPTVWTNALSSLPQDILICNTNFANKFPKLVGPTGICYASPLKFNFVSPETSRVFVNAVCTWTPNAANALETELSEEDMKYTFEEVMNKVYSGRFYFSPRGEGKGRLALVLGGGGAKCAYQVGVVSVLESQLADFKIKRSPRGEIDFDLIAGTSGGALNAVPIALGASSSNDNKEFLGMWKALTFDQIADLHDLGRYELAILLFLFFVLISQSCFWFVRRKPWTVAYEYWFTGPRFWGATFIVRAAIFIVSIFSIFAICVFVFAVSLPFNLPWHRVYVGLFYFSCPACIPSRIALFIFLVYFFIYLLIRRSSRLWAWPLPLETPIYLYWSAYILLVAFSVVVWASNNYSLFRNDGLTRVVSAAYAKFGQNGVGFDSENVASYKRDLIITSSVFNSSDPELPSDLYFFIDKHSQFRANDPRFVRLLDSAANKVSVIDAVRGSSALYPVFPAQKLEGFPVIGKSIELVDGGFAHNSPIEAARQWSATDIIVIEPSPKEQKSREGIRFIDQIGSALQHLFDAAQGVDAKCCKQDVKVFSIRPSKKDFIGTLDFFEAATSRAIDQGIEDAKGFQFRQEPSGPRFILEGGDPLCTTCGQ